MKRIVLLVLAMCMLSVGVFAGDATKKEMVFHFDRYTEVTAEGNPALSYEEIARIAESLVKPQEKKPILRLNPRCAAGNHTLTSTRFTTTRHYAYTTSPKCERNEYLVTTCTRIGCFYQTEKLISSNRIPYCHG